MSGDKILAEERLSYVLFQRGDRVLLTLLSGGVVSIDHTVVVPNEEALALARDRTKLKVYVEALLADRDELVSRGLSPPVWPDERGDA